MHIDEPRTIFHTRQQLNHKEKRGAPPGSFRWLGKNNTERVQVLPVLPVARPQSLIEGIVVGTSKGVRIPLTSESMPPGTDIKCQIRTNEMRDSDVPADEQRTRASIFSLNGECKSKVTDLLTLRRWPARFSIRASLNLGNSKGHDKGGYLLSESESI
jgi:hypothetical protein